MDIEYNYNAIMRLNVDNVLRQNGVKVHCLMLWFLQWLMSICLWKSGCVYPVGWCINGV